MNSIRSLSFILALVAAIGLLHSPPLEAQCGCQRMTLKSRGTTEIMCSDIDFPDLLNMDECIRDEGRLLGCHTRWAYRCPLGPNSKHYSDDIPWQRFGFQPIAALTPDTDVDQCDTGQLLQLSIVNQNGRQENREINKLPRGGITKLSKQVGRRAVYILNREGARFPQIGHTTRLGLPSYGADGYNYNPEESRHSYLFGYDEEQNTLSWWDNPDQTKDEQNEVAFWDYNFVAYVKGTRGQPSCTCTFNIQVAWPANGEPAAVLIPVRRLSKNCRWR
jgi:hypothetical protein